MDIDFTPMYGRWRAAPDQFPVAAQDQTEREPARESGELGERQVHMAEPGGGLFSCLTRHLLANIRCVRLKIQRYSRRTNKILASGTAETSMSQPIHIRKYPYILNETRVISPSLLAN